MIDPKCLVALAGEGVPVGCLVRAFGADRGMVRLLLEDAKASGLIAEMPAPDWHGCRFDDRPKVGHPMPAPMLTRERLLAGRYEIDNRRAGLLLALYDGPAVPPPIAAESFLGIGLGTLPKEMSRLRLAVAKDSVGILFRRRDGYMMSAAGRERLAGIFRRAGL